MSTCWNPSDRIRGRFYNDEFASAPTRRPHSRTWHRPTLFFGDRCVGVRCYTTVLFLWVYYANCSCAKRWDSPMNAALLRSVPTTAKRTVSRGRLPNSAYRVREYLTEKEVQRLIKAAGSNRWGHRDATMILIAYRHGLRASELCALQWDQVDLAHGRLHVSRAKNGVPSVHPLGGV
jgi:integrase